MDRAGILTLAPASSLSLEELADVFTRGYEGYVVPLHVDAALLAFMVETYDVDLDRSRVARDETGPVGVALLGVRGRAGWIGGMGVAAEARRRGIGRALMEGVLAEARAAGLGEVTLEVIEENAAAIALYEHLGFRLVRNLQVWSLDAEPDQPSAEPVDVDRALAAIARLRTAREPWQRADETVAHLRTRGAPSALGACDDGAVVFGTRNGRVSVYQLAARDEAVARRLLAGARARGDALGFLNVPEGDPAATALAALGGRVDVRQRELALVLEGAPSNA